MTLSKWIILIGILLAAMGHYSVNAEAIQIKPHNANANIEIVAPNQADNKADKKAQAIKLSQNINLNKAKAEELANLPGIGTKKALAIVKYRELNGDFTSVEELTNVKGIGPKMLSKINQYVTVKN